VTDQLLVGADLDRLRSLDGAKWRRYGDEVIPAWVADMDFASPDCALDAMRRVIDRSDIGYNLAAVRALPEAFADWQEQTHGWRPDTDRLMLFNDVLHVLEYAVFFLTEPGDGIVLLTPIYPPFIKIVEEAGRRIVDCPLDPSTGRFDGDVLDSVVDDRTRIVLWCNPHNPTGRVFDDTEMAALAEVAERRDLTVLSDEVWADLVHPGAVHRPIATVPGLAERAVTVSSASKSFNLAGLRCAVAHVGSDVAFAEFDRHPARLRGHVNTLAAEATLACWREGRPWLDALRRHLVDQLDHLGRRLAVELPAIGWQRPEATYLVWLDGRELDLDDEFATVLLKRSQVALSPGADFGDRGRGHARLNIATSRAILDDVIDRMVATLGSA
jgi:cystathionine beta-lyase